MRTIFAFLLLLLASSLGAQTAIDESSETRTIGYVEQEEPGKLILLTLIDTGRLTGGAIYDIKNGIRNSEPSFTKQQFEFVWSSLSSPEFGRYEFAPSGSDSISDPKFYTISKMSAAGNLNYRIPIESEAPEILSVIDVLKTIIAENSR